MKKLIEDKTVWFNEGLLKNGNTDTDEDLSESDTDDDATEGSYLFTVKEGFFTGLMFREKKFIIYVTFLGHNFVETLL